MIRFKLSSATFEAQTLPLCETGSVETVFEAWMGDGAPDLFYWDVAVTSPTRDERIRFGRDALDPFIAASYDLTCCCAVRSDRLDNLIKTGVIQGRDEIGRAVSLLSRTPNVRTQHCPNLTALLSEPPMPRAEAAALSSTVELITVALISRHEVDDLKVALDVLAAQSFTSRIEIVVLIAGANPAALKVRAKGVDAWALDRREFRVRRYMLSGDFLPSYVANMAVGLASGEVVVIVDPQARPGDGTTLQRLAEWADGADVASACPIIEHEGRLAAAGLGVDPKRENVVVPVQVASFGEATRLCAAPSPWIFATLRRRWLQGGGIAATPDALWTASLAADEGPKGRHLMVGSLTASLQAPPQTSDGVLLDRPLRRSALWALTGEVKSQPAILTPRPAVVLTEAAADVSKPVKSATRATPSRLQPSFADPPARGTGALNLLVFADGLGASQSIAFVEGLRAARAQGRAATVIYTEADLAGGRDEGSIVQDLFARHDPTIVVVSRMADAKIWEGVRRAARSGGVPILFHIDDDLLDPPMALGVERYRAARNPRRNLTLHAILDEADLTLTSTPRLLQRLRARTSHGRFAVLAGGAAAWPTALPRVRWRDEVVVGYMGSASHNADLAMIAPALNTVRAMRPMTEFVLFGSIAKQASAGLIAGTVRREAGVFGDYAAFKERLRSLELDIGLAPLTANGFNAAKTSAKWLEYSEAGAAVLASDIEPYRPAADRGALLAVGNDGWTEALIALIDDAPLRNQMVAASQRLIRADYGWEAFESRLLETLLNFQHLARAA